MNIIFFGTSDFSFNILKYLIENKVDIKAIVTKEDSFKGNKKIESPVKKKSESFKKIPIYQPYVLDKKFFDILSLHSPDVFIVVAYGKIFPKNLIDLPKLCINVHASLLPKYRGADPIRRCLMNREKKTGITIMEMAEKLDSGDMLLQKEADILDGTDFGKLEKILCDISKKMVLEVLDLFKRGKIKRVRQNDNLATYAPKIKKEEMFINWRDSAYNNYYKIKALSPSPCARGKIVLHGKEKLIKILDAKVVDMKGSPREILKFDKNDFIVGCVERSLKILKVQLEGKKPMDSSFFYLGVKEKPKFL